MNTCVCRCELYLLRVWMDRLRYLNVHGFLNGFLWVLISFEVIHIYWLFLQFPIVLYPWIYLGIYTYGCGYMYCLGWTAVLNVEFDLIQYQS